MATHIQNYKTLLETRRILNEEIEQAETKMVMAPENQAPQIVAFIEKLRPFLKTYKYADIALKYLNDNLVCAPMFCTEEWDDNNIAVTIYYKLSNGQSVMYTTVSADNGTDSYFGRVECEEPYDVHEDQPDYWIMSEDLFDKTTVVEKCLKKGLLRNKDIPSAELLPFWPLLVICRTCENLDVEEIENLCLDYCQFVDELAGLNEDSDSEGSDCGKVTS